MSRGSLRPVHKERFNRPQTVSYGGDVSANVCKSRVSDPTGHFTGLFVCVKWSPMYAMHMGTKNC